MGVRIVWIGKAPSLLDAEGQASDVNSTQTLFGSAVTSTTAAVAETVLGSHYLLVKGPEYNINNALDDMPEDWHMTWAESRDGDDAGPGTWLPDWNVASFLLGQLL